MSRSVPLHRFPFSFAASYRLPALAFAITPLTSAVEVDEELRVSFGPWRLRTPVANVVGCELSGGFSLLRTAGPVRLSLSDHGVTFATNPDRAVCVRFGEPVRVLDPTGRLRHPGATLTVADPEGLAAALGHPVA